MNIEERNEVVVDALVRAMDFCEAGVMEAVGRCADIYSDDEIKGMLYGMRLCISTMTGMAEVYGLEVDDANS